MVQQQPFRRTLHDVQRNNPREDLTILNISAPNIRAPQYIRQTLADIKGDIGSKTIIVGEFSTPLIAMDRSPRCRVNKGTQVLNDTLDEMDLIDILRTFHPNAEEHTFFSSANGTFSRIEHILGLKSNFSKVERVEIVSDIFFKHNTIGLDINYKKGSVKNTNTWRLDNTFLNNQQVAEEIKREIKKFLETNDSENMTTQVLWDVAGTVLGGRFIAVQFYLKKQQKH